MGEMCYLEDPDLLNFDEDHVLQCLLPDLTYHRRVAKENIQKAAQAYKKRYDAHSSVKDHTFAVGDVVWVRTPRPSGQAVGKTDKANQGPYRIMGKVGSVLFKLQDVNTGVALSSLKHGDSLTHCPSDGASRLRVLHGRHGEPRDLGNRDQGRTGDIEGQGVQRPDARGEAGAADSEDEGNYHDDRAPVPVTNPIETAQEIRMLRPSPPRLVKSKVNIKKHSQTGPAERTLQTKSGKEKVATPSTHSMSLRHKSPDM